MLRNFGHRLEDATAKSLSALRSAQGRLLAGMALASTLALFLWPKNPWVFDPKALVALVVAAITWLASIAPDHIKSEHDVALLRKFRDIIDSDHITFLRRHDFGGTFQRQYLAGVFRIADVWEGADFDFDDPMLKREFAGLIDQIVQFAKYAAHNTWPVHGAIDFGTAVPERQHDEEWSEVTERRIKKLNDDASTLADVIDAFILKARKRLG